MDERPGILFTAFEPSGDEHAAPVVAKLRELLPGVPIWALGGRHMEEAGAQIIERTTDRAAMLGGALGKVREQLGLRRRMAAWLDRHPIAAHVPTDSPAANWAFCRMVKRRWGRGEEAARGLGRVVHLVAPQVWAWSSWRVRRLQKWSDLVLCVLPFEPAWFAKYGVATKYIGHPLFDHALDTESLGWQAVSYGGGKPRLALLPGSREAEIAANWPVMMQVWRELSSRHEQLEAVAAVLDEAGAQHVRDITPQLPDRVKLVTGQTEAVLHWADVVLVVSGTATLHVARHLKPMAVLFKASPMMWHGIGRWIVNTQTYSLPNLIACGGPEADPSQHVVKEFVPFLPPAHQAGPIVAELASLIEQPRKRDAQVEALRAMLEKFSGHSAGSEAAAEIARMAAPALDGSAALPR